MFWKPAIVKVPFIVKGDSFSNFILKVSLMWVLLSGVWLCETLNFERGAPQGTVLFNVMVTGIRFARFNDIFWVTVNSVLLNR